MLADCMGVSPLGVIRARGADTVDLLHRLSTNDLRSLNEAGHIRSTVFTTSQGKMVDWTWVIKSGDDIYIATSEGRAERLQAWIEQYIIMEDVDLTDVSDDYRHVFLSGSSRLAVARLEDEPGGDQLVETSMGLWWRGLGVYSGRVEGLIPVDCVESLIEAGASAGLGEASALQIEEARLRAGIPSAVHEFKDDVSPLELRLGPVAISWNKGCYIGQEVISRLDSYDKIARVMMGFESDSVLPSEVEFKIRRDGKPLGRVTSFLNLEAGGVLGLSVVKSSDAEPGSAELVWEGGSVSARLVNRPFWDA